MLTFINLQALACAQVLCRCSQNMAKALVKGNIHILLFTLLYKDTEDNSQRGVEEKYPLSIDFSSTNSLLVSGQHYTSEDKDKVQECEWSCMPHDYSMDTLHILFFSLLSSGY